MKITIITVVRNNEKTINDAINSVLSQSYSNIEYIIIDGKSFDNTVQLIENYKDKLAYFLSEEDDGIYDAMNKGIKASTGDVIGILNSDDLYYNPFVIDTVMNQFLINPKLDILYGNLDYVKNENINKTVRTWKSKPFGKNFFENGNVPPHPTLFLKKIVYEKAGFFNLNYKLASDYDFMLRIFKKFDFNSKFINLTIVKMRLGGATNQNFKNIVRQNIEILNSWKDNNLNPPFLLFPLRLIKKLKQFFIP